jgi:nucleoid-associated protein YgaU
MLRYLRIPTIKKMESGKRYYSTVLPKNPVFSEFPNEYTSRAGDRWDLLAHKIYGNSTRWYALALANGGANGSIFIKPGTQIRIPEL